MPEECQKAKDELKTHWGLQKILFSLSKQKLSVISKKDLGCVHTPTSACRGKGQWRNTESKCSHNDYCCSIHASFMDWNKPI